MADTKISGLGALTALADEDLFVVVDVSDTSMAATGTNKKIATPDVRSKIIAGLPAVPTSGAALADTGAGVKSAKTATVTDAAVSASSKLLVGWGNVLTSDANSPEMDAVSFSAAPGSGSFVLTVSGPVVQGPYRVNYLVGV